MNLDNPQQSCLEWQQRLKLQDWDVSVKIVPHRDSKNAWGNVEWNLHEKIAQEQAINAIARALVNLKNANLQTQGETPNPGSTP